MMIPILIRFWPKIAISNRFVSRRQLKS